MKIRKFAFGIAMVLGLLGLTSCADMSKRDSTIVGAGVGAVTGGVVTDSAAGVIGGAIVGGVIGHEVGRHNNRYPSETYYYNESEARHYHRHYRRGHTRVRCNDGVVRKIGRNACRYHGGARYYW